VRFRRACPSNQSLSGAERGIRHADREGLEREGRRRGVCHPVPGLRRVHGGLHRPTEAGGRQHLEYWIPAEDLAAFNAAIIGKIEVVAEFR